MDAVQRKNLTLVLEKLRTIPPERFDFARYVGPSWQGKEDLSCGTTACALGWATTIPELRAQGLYLNELCYPDLRDGTGYTGLERLQEMFHVMFGLSVEQAHFLFIPGTPVHGFEVLTRDATPEDVAKRLEDFLLSGIGP